MTAGDDRRRGSTPAASDRPTYEAVVVGGGPAGTTTALYTTRLGHRTAVFEAEGGRHANVDHVHNLYGVSEDVSGAELAAHAADQLEEYGGTYFRDRVADVRRTDGSDGARFVVEATNATVAADRVVFATGFTDVGPSVPGLERFTGRGLHYCLHCDAYSLGDGPVFVLGHDDAAAHVAMLLLNVTDDVDLLLDGRDHAWSEERERQLAAHPVDRIDADVVGAYARESQDDDGDEPWLGGLLFGDAGDPGGVDDDADGSNAANDNADGADGTNAAATDAGTKRDYLGGFAMYGREYDTDLAASLGCELADDGALAVDENYETSVDGAYAAGDVTHGQNQTAIALGDGAAAGIAIHEDLREFPRQVADGEAVDPVDVPAAPPALRARMRSVRSRRRHAGLRSPPPDR